MDSLEWSLNADAGSGFVRRWYDSKPEVQQAIALIEAMPESIIEVLAKGIMLIADREFEVSETIMSRRALGIDKILPLYHSMHNRRSYDAYPTLHKVVNSLMLLTDDNRLYICNRVRELVSFIREYLKKCQSFETDPELEDVVGLTKTFVDQGSNEVQDLLMNIEHRFNQMVKKAMQRITPRAIRQANLQGDSGKRMDFGDDMKLRE